MEISKFKDQGILLKTKYASIALDPQVKGNQLAADASSTDFALSTEPEKEPQKYKDENRIFSWPGEFEVKGIAIHALPTDQNDTKTQNPLLFVIYTEEGKILYLPELKKEMHSDLIEKIGDVDLMIFPASGSDKIWHSTIEEVEPKSILPLPGEISMDAFLSKIGMTKPAESEKINIKSKSEFRSDVMGIYLLA